VSAETVPVGTGHTVAGGRRRIGFAGREGRRGAGGGKAGGKQRGRGGKAGEFHGLSSIVVLEIPLSNFSVLKRVIPM
jgi:hypothetical protein